MKTKNTTIELLKKNQGYAVAVETLGIYESSVIGKYEWGIFHNGLGVRWYCIHKINRSKFIHIFEKDEEMIEYIKSKII